MYKWSCKRSLKAMSMGNEDLLMSVWNSILMKFLSFFYNVFLLNVWKIHIFWTVNYNTTIMKLCLPNVKPGVVSEYTCTCLPWIQISAEIMGFHMEILKTLSHYWGREWLQGPELLFMSAPVILITNTFSILVGAIIFPKHFL